MKERENRVSVIRKILETEQIANQNNLKKRLEKEGFEITQATLSRDLAAMKVMRVPNADKRYIYTLPSRSAVSQTADDNSPLNACKSIAFSQNLAVLKCLPSFAPSVAMLVDGLKMEAVVGTIAGDDTVLIVLRENWTHERFLDALFSRLPELRDRI
ncbi:MAG: ArgR family transcriptional regulator [Candidatus Neomarinimicrobiota bacterium]